MMLALMAQPPVASGEADQADQNDQIRRMLLFAIQINRAFSFGGSSYFARIRDPAPPVCSFSISKRGAGVSERRESRCPAGHWHFDSIHSGSHHDYQHNANP